MYIQMSKLMKAKTTTEIIAEDGVVIPAGKEVMAEEVFSNDWESIGYFKTRINGKYLAHKDVFETSLEKIDSPTLFSINGCRTIFNVVGSDENGYGLSMNVRPFMEEMYDGFTYKYSLKTKEEAEELKKKIYARGYIFLEHWNFSVFMSSPFNGILKDAEDYLKANKA